MENDFLGLENNFCLLQKFFCQGNFYFELNKNDFILADGWGSRFRNPFLISISQFQIYFFNDSFYVIRI